MGGCVFRDSVLVRFREVRFEEMYFEVRVRRGHLSGMCLGARVRWVRFSGLLFWSGFVGYVLGRCVLR